MRLNKGKCELLQFGTNKHIKFRDGETVGRQGEVKYLGCNLNDRADGNKELNKRIAACMGIYFFFIRHSIIVWSVNKSVK